MNLTTPLSSPDGNQRHDENQKKSLQIKLNELVRKVSVQTIILR